MYKVLDKKTFKELPKKEQDIFIESGAKDQQLMFQDEVGHQGLTWQDYIPETKQYLLEKYDGQDGKESFIYKINETDYIPKFDHSIDRTFWQEGDYIQWDTDFMTREQLEEYAEGI